MKILHLDSNHDILAQMLEDAGHENHFDFTSEKGEIEQVLSNYDGLVVRSRFPIDASFLSQAKNLKCIGRVGAGLENIDLDAAGRLDITCFNAPEGNRNAVGEHSLALLLALFNKLNKGDQEIRNGAWNREGNRGIELDGRTVGLIGYGNMGKAFARKLRGFDCEVLCYDIKENVGDENARQVSLDVLHMMSDVISLHTPQTASTMNMIDNTFIDKMKKPFYLINTARGKSVVTDDLVKGLKSGKVLGAGLDVLEYEKSSFETLFQDNDMPESFKELLTMNNVILSPHVAGWTVESKKLLAEVIAQKMINHLEV